MWSIKPDGRGFEMIAFFSHTRGYWRFCIFYNTALRALAKMRQDYLAYIHALLDNGFSAVRVSQLRHALCFPVASRPQDALSCSSSAPGKDGLYARRVVLVRMLIHTKHGELKGLSRHSGLSRIRHGGSNQSTHGNRFFHLWWSGKKSYPPKTLIEARYAYEHNQVCWRYSQWAGV
jgi:hypothetical protein